MKASSRAAFASAFFVAPAAFSAGLVAGGMAADSRCGAVGWQSHSLGSATHSLQPRRGPWQPSEVLGPLRVRAPLQQVEKSQFRKTARTQKARYYFSISAVVIASVGLALKYVYYESFGSGCLDKIRGLKKRKNNKRRTVSSLSGTR